MEGQSSEGLSNQSTNNSNATFELLSLDDWINKFGRIYGKRHEKHTTEYMISRLVEEVAELVNPMESQDIERIAPNLSDVFSWICSIAHKLNLDLSNLAWKKYGENAPRPSWSSNAQPALSDFSQPANLKQWQEFISALYRTENARLSPMNALVAMMKDVGDTAMLHRKRATNDQIASKMAAILAWTLTIAQLLKLDLGKVVFSKYDDHCPVCGKQVCDTDICHPLATMYVSFGESVTDEEKYIVLDICASFGFRSLVDSLSQANATRDLSSSLDLISNSDAACILLSQSASEPTLYTQIFETLVCFSSLSKGDVFVFAKDPTKGIASFISRTFSSENIVVNQYADTNNLKAALSMRLEELVSKRKSLVKRV
jgi:NTP pyrophosphatase (non-canonical NTP hydrolase)